MSTPTRTAQRSAYQVSDNCEACIFTLTEGDLETNLDTNRTLACGEHLRIS